MECLESLGQTTQLLEDLPDQGTIPGGLVHIFPEVSKVAGISTLKHDVVFVAPCESAIH
jgi:hypothetical protein